jgi:hypothetical protein
VRVHTYCPADADGGADAHPDVGAVVPDDDAAYMIDVDEMPTPSLPAIPSLPVSPFAPVAPHMDTLYPVSDVPSVYDHTVRVHRYCPGVDEGTVACHPDEGALVPLVDFA